MEREGQKEKDVLEIGAYCPYYPPHLGGLEKYAEELHKQLAGDGHKVTVLTPGLPRSTPAREVMKINQGSITVLRFPAWEIIYGYPLPNVCRGLFWRQMKEMRGKKFDVLLSTTRFFITSIMAVWQAKICHIPHIHIEHGSGYVVSKNKAVWLAAYLYDQSAGRLVFRLSDLNISPSMSAKKFIGRFDKRYSPVIYRGLPLKEFDETAPAIELREKYPDQVIITYAGRLILEKGILDLIKAVSRLPREKYSLCLIGSGNLEKRIKETVRQLGLSGKVLLLGQQSEQKIISWLKASDIVVNPSYSEGLPTVVLEAAALGRAVIAAKVGGTGEIIRDKISGLLFKPGDIDALAERIKLLGENAQMRNQLGQQAAIDVRQKFSWPKAAKAYYKQMVSVGHSPHL